MPINPAPADLPLTQLPGFDPRTAPVIAVDAHLPPVRQDALSPQALRERFRSPPQWQPEVWAERRFSDRPMANASVLVGIVMRERPTVLLTERTAHLSTHSGQIAFPGGKQDDTDTDEAHTALREAQEEIGLEPGLVEVIGRLPTYTTGSQFIITPVVGLVSPGTPADAQCLRGGRCVRGAAGFPDEPGASPAPCHRLARRAPRMVFHAIPGRRDRALRLGRHGRHVAQFLPLPLGRRLTHRP